MEKDRTGYKEKGCVPVPDYSRLALDPNQSATIQFTLIGNNSGFINFARIDAKKTSWFPFIQPGNATTAAPFPQLMINPKESTTFDVSVVMPQSVHAFNQSAVPADRVSERSPALTSGAPRTSAAAAQSLTYKDYPKIDDKKLNFRNLSAPLKSKLLKAQVNIEDVRKGLQDSKKFDVYKLEELLKQQVQDKETVADLKRDLWMASKIGRQGTTAQRPEEIVNWLEKEMFSGGSCGRENLRGLRSACCSKYCEWPVKKEVAGNKSNEAEQKTRGLYFEARCEDAKELLRGKNDAPSIALEERRDFVCSLYPKKLRRLAAQLPWVEHKETVKPDKKQLLNEFYEKCHADTSTFTVDNTTRIEFLGVKNLLHNIVGDQDKAIHKGIPDVTLSALNLTSNFQIAMEAQAGTSHFFRIVPVLVPPNTEVKLDRRCPV
jgi:hypothetical protein